MTCDRIFVKLCSLALALSPGFLSPGFLAAQEPASQDSAKTPPAAREAEKVEAPTGKGVPQWRPLPTQEIGSWEACNFGGDGVVEFVDGVAKLGFGDPLTGIRLKQEEFPKENFELELEARRTSGFDFFCGLTFPVGEGNASFILGGWSGGVVGLSSIDQRDASENETTSFQTFKNDQWYTVRVRVDDDKVQCWIDDKQFVDVERGDHEFTIRNEMDPSLPVGIAGFQVTSEIRNVRWRKLDAAPQTDK